MDAATGGGLTGRPQPFSISRLEAQPRYCGVVSERVWNAWWREQGYPLSEIEGWFQECLGPEPMPLTLVAHDGDLFLGTVSVIASDMDERPEYTPWVAALWVDPGHRNMGVGAALVEAAAEAAFGLGFQPIYLCATPDNAPFYIKRGWRRIEQDVAGLDILSLSQG